MTKLSPGTLLLGVFAVLFGLIGASVAKQYLREKPQPEPVAAQGRQTVPLASTDLPPDRTLTLGDVMLVKMSREEMRKRGVPGDHMTDPRQVIGRTLQTAVKRGQAFRTTEFYPEGIGPSVAKRLKPGYRAVTIALEDVAAQAGLVSPGAYIDVILRTFPNEKEHVPETTVTLLLSVEVLAIGRETSLGARATQVGRSRGSAASTVTLAVTPDQASALKVVENRGTLSLILRNPDGEENLARTAPRTLASLLGLPKPEKPLVTEIYRRGQLSIATFDKGHRTVSRDLFRGLPLGVGAVPGGLPQASPALATSSTAVEPEPCDCED